MNLTCTIQCDTTDFDEAMEVAIRHMERSAAFAECFDARFPNSEGLMEIDGCPTGEPLNMIVVVRPSDALKSFLQDLVA